MTIGIDFYDTITTAPEVYVKWILHITYMNRNKVCILSAVHEKNMKRFITAATDAFIPPHMLQPVIFTNYDDVPKLKYDKAKELGVSLLIDDRIDTCQYFIDHGILAVSPAQYKPKPQLPRTLAEQREYNLKHARH